MSLCEDETVRVLDPREQKYALLQVEVVAEP
jgi:hypothetical protein